MMNRIPIKIKDILRRILRSIAFFPALITVGYIILALLLLSAENHGMTAWVKERFPILIIQDANTGRAILTTLIGATISLTVFSFSMVMVVLNQAASNYTPRLLPRLVSNKRHQIVLGIYIGSICFHLIVLLSILPDAEQWQIPGFTVFFAVVLGILCVSLFVYFIHGISESIQVDHIIANIYHRTKHKLAFEQSQSDDKSVIDIPDTKDWQTIPALKMGYFIDANFSRLAEISKEKQGEIRLLIPFGMFVLPNIPLACCSWKATEEDLEKIHNQLDLIEDDPSELTEVGFKRMTEVAVKAMSPGINDPGTALSAINYLSALLQERLQVPENNCYTDADGAKVYYQEPSFSSILMAVMESLRVYCKHDTILVRKLLAMLHFLYLQSNDTLTPSQKDSIHREMRALVEDAQVNIENSFDRQMIAKAIEGVNTDLPKDRHLSWK